MPPISLEAPPEQLALPAPSVGIIYPPPEVRNIVDKTAGFVARNGPEFEQRIKQNEVNNPKFNFLSPGDPYNAYYEHRVKSIREGVDDEAEKEKEKAAKPAGGEGVKATATDAMKQRQSELLKQAQKEQEPPPPKDPPADFEFTADPPSISAFDLDVVKLTAQFVARNGRQFLTNLMNREQRNYQFDFLRPQHSLFQYFTRLLEQYTKVLIPPKDMMKKLHADAQDEKAVKEQIAYRVRWIRHQEAQKRRMEEEAERERVSYAQVDWHNFVVVETVDYQQWETGNFPPPATPESVGARVLMQRRVESNPPARGGVSKTKTTDEVSGESNTQVEDMDEDSSSEESDESDEDDGTRPAVATVDSAPAVSQPPPPSLPTPGNVEVRKYDPKAAKKAAAAVKEVDAASEEFLISPITGERIPASKVQEHMRIGLLDPRWVEERDKQITAKATEDAVFAPGKAIERSLQNLAERRTDIFGVGEDAATEAEIGKKLGDDTEDDLANQREANSWDGHTVSAEGAVRAARAKITLDDQIKEINRQKGLMADKDAIGPSASRPPPVARPPPPMQPPMPPPPPVAVIPMAVPRPVGMPPPFGTGANLTPVFMAPQPTFVPQPPPMMAQPPAIPLPPAVELDDEPPNKRPRGEDHLIPENLFAQQSPSPVTFQVVCPVMAEKSDWKLSGQAVSLTMPLMESVSTIKMRLHEETGMPPGKQKLQLEALFLKDANSLAYYNVRPGSVVMLQIKERGGRKK